MTTTLMARRASALSAADARSTRDAELNALRKRQIAKNIARNASTQEDSAVSTMSAMDWQAKLRALKQADRQYKNQSIRFMQGYKASTTADVGVNYTMTQQIGSSSQLQKSSASLIVLTSDEKRNDEEEKKSDREEPETPCPFVETPRLHSNSTKPNYSYSVPLLGGIRKKTEWAFPLPSEHDTAVMAYQEQLADFQEALQNYRGILRIRQLRLGRNHLKVASMLHNMGDVYYMMNDFDSALASYNKAYETRLTKLGENHIDVASTCNNMGVVFMKQGQYDQAMKYFTSALKIRKQKYGPDNVGCSDSLHNMGLVHKHQKEYKQAILLFQDSLRIRRIRLGEKNAHVADTLYNLGVTYANTYDNVESLKSHKEALTVYRDSGLSNGNSCIESTIQWIEWAKKEVQLSK